MGRFYLWKLAAAVLATEEFHSQEIHHQEVTYIGNSYISLFISFLGASLHKNLVINEIKYQVLEISSAVAFSTFSLKIKEFLFFVGARWSAFIFLS